MKKELRYYLTPGGKAAFAEWIKKIKDHTTQSRIDRRLERMEFGNYGDYKSLGGGVYELRLAFGPGYRVYFAVQNEVIVLLCGGDKSSQDRDIEIAKQCWKELRSRKL